jgi:arsenite-transporting ATPase
VRAVPQFDREMIGAERLTEIGRALFGDDDPTSFFYRGRPYQVTAEADGGHVLEVALPFTARDAVELSRDGDELQLRVAGLRRTIVLPRALVNAPTAGAKMDDGVLRIRFNSRPDAKPAGSKRGDRR